MAVIISQEFECADMSYPYPSVATFEIEVIPETVGQYSGLKRERGKEIFQDDIYFEEIEHDLGDIREYYVCTWVSEWCRFVWLHISEYQDYLDNGVEHLERDRSIVNTFGLNTNRMHYAGNVHDNPELLIEANHVQN